MKLPVLLVLCAPIAAQTPAVDRGAAGRAPMAQRVEQAKGFLGDSFRLGDKADTWMIESMRVWALADASPACGRTKPGDQLEKVTLYGALYNPPVPGQAECDCHALVPVVSAPLEKGSSRFANTNVRLTADKDVWQIDFRDVRWSVPGGMDVLFAVRAVARSGQACAADKTWTLAATPAESSYRLRLFDKDLVPAGFAEPDPQPRQIRVQVWAHKN